jgi:hypothetical protein
MRGAPAPRRRGQPRAPAGPKPRRRATPARCSPAHPYARAPPRPAALLLVFLPSFIAFMALDLVWITVVGKDL